MEEWGVAPQRALASLHVDCGFPLSARKHRAAAQVRKFKGVVTDFTKLRHDGVVRVYVDEGRREKILTRIEAALEEDALTPAQAASLVGKLTFTLTWAFGKTGRAAKQPLQDRANSDEADTELMPSTRRALRYLRDVVTHLPPKEYNLREDPRPPVLIWSDAMYASGKGKGGFVVYIPPYGDKAEELYYAEHH